MSNTDRVSNTICQYIDNKYLSVKRQSVFVVHDNRSMKNIEEEAQYYRDLLNIIPESSDPVVLVIDLLNIYRLSFLGMCETSQEEQKHSDYIGGSGYGEFDGICAFMCIFTLSLLHSVKLKYDDKRSVIIEIVLKPPHAFRRTRGCDMSSEGVFKNRDYDMKHIKYACNNANIFHAAIDAITTHVSKDDRFNSDLYHIKFSFCMGEDYSIDDQNASNKYEKSDESLGNLSGYDDLLCLKKAIFYSDIYGTSQDICVLSCDKQISNQEVIPPGKPRKLDEDIVGRSKKMRSHDSIPPSKHDKESPIDRPYQYEAFDISIIENKPILTINLKSPIVKINESIYYRKQYTKFVHESNGFWGDDTYTKPHYGLVQAPCEFFDNCNGGRILRHLLKHDHCNNYIIESKDGSKFTWEDIAISTKISTTACTNFAKLNDSIREATISKWRLDSEELSTCINRHETKHLRSTTERERSRKQHDKEMKIRRHSQQILDDQKEISTLVRKEMIRLSKVNDDLNLVLSKCFSEFASSRGNIEIHKRRFVGILNSLN